MISYSFCGERSINHNSEGKCNHGPEDCYERRDQDSTGLAGLDRVIDGGVRDKCTCCSRFKCMENLFCMQYIVMGLNTEEIALYVSMKSSRADPKGSSHVVLI
jgi:hypothetical protein